MKGGQALHCWGLLSSHTLYLSQRQLLLQGHACMPACIFPIMKDIKILLRSCHHYHGSPELHHDTLLLLVHHHPHLIPTLYTRVFFGDQFTTLFLDERSLLPSSILLSSWEPGCCNTSINTSVNYFFISYKNYPFCSRLELVHRSLEARLFQANPMSSCFHEQRPGLLRGMLLLLAQQKFQRAKTCSRDCFTKVASHQLLLAKIVRVRSQYLCWCSTTKNDQD
jgi:hypothetical protein